MISDCSIVDAIGFDPKTNKANLYIYDDLSWDLGNHLELIAKKVNLYCKHVSSKQFRDYLDSLNKPVDKSNYIFILVSRYQVPSGMFIELRALASHLPENIDFQFVHMPD